MTKTNDAEISQVKNTDQREKCGIVMPISECDGCSEDHWLEVREIIKRAADDAGYEAFLVSEADDYGVIQKRIVQNLYDCPIVICDISGRNANVMFELGMRLAFDKNTIVIKDDKTPFSFDTSPIEHLTYPRDLRFSKIEKFQNLLSEKIGKTRSLSGDNSFLKSFGAFKVAEIQVEKAPISEVMLEEIQSLKKSIYTLGKVIHSRKIVDQSNPRLRHEAAGDIMSIKDRSNKTIVIEVPINSTFFDVDAVEDLAKDLRKNRWVKDASVSYSELGIRLAISFMESATIAMMRSIDQLAISRVRSLIEG